jgi:hypothetical protein
MSKRADSDSTEPHEQDIGDISDLPEETLELDAAYQPNRWAPSGQRHGGGGGGLVCVEQG